MWSPLAVVLLLVATAEGLAIALLLVERRDRERVTRALGELRGDVTIARETLEREVRATREAAERAADAAEELREPVQGASAMQRPIGFRS